MSSATTKLLFMWINIAKTRSSIYEKFSPIDVYKDI